MPEITPREMSDVRRIAFLAAPLSTAAMKFRAALDLLLRNPLPQSQLEISIDSSSTDVVLNFQIGTPHGVVEAIFDHAFLGGNLVGRYRFYLVEATPTREFSAREVWTMLFNEIGSATWDPGSDFEWNFMDDPRLMEVSMETFVLTLLSKIQARLDRYDL